MSAKLALRPRTRPAAPSLETLLENVRDDFDELLAEVRSGVRDQRHFEWLEGRFVDGLCGDIRRAFRSRR